MPELGWHLMHRLVDDRVLVPSTPALRLASRIVLERGRAFGLLSYGFADNHLHTLVLCDRRRAGRFAQVVETALHKRLRLDVPFGPFFPEAVRRQGHLYNTFRYCIRQDELHGVGLDPFGDGTALPSLLGLRVPGAWLIGLVRTHLPRITRADLLELTPAVGAARAPGVEPGWDLLADAAAAANALADLGGSFSPVREARRAAVHLASPRLRTGAIAERLATSRTTVKRLRRGAPDEALVRAVELQLQLRSVSPEP